MFNYARYYSHLRIILSYNIRELKTKYVNTFFGMAWYLIQPISVMILYTIIFGYIFKVKVPGDESVQSFVRYLWIGVAIWSLQTEILIKSINIVVENANLYKKVPLHKSISIINLITISLIPFFVMIVLLLLFDGFVIKISYDYEFVLLFEVILVAIFLPLSLGLFLSLFNVYFRDVMQTIQITNNFLFWATPVVYMRDAVPDFLFEYMKFNPYYYVLEAAHNSIGIGGVLKNELHIILILSLFAVWLSISFFINKVDMVVDDA